jgi:zinc transport system ATP-binding protein
MNETIINVSQLDFGYGKNLILENVNLQVAKGEFIGMFGPNGGGKTTLLKLLMGFLRPLKGEVFLFGKTPKQARKKISYVPQISRYDRQFPISVLELVLTGLLSSAPWWGGTPSSHKEKAIDALKKVGLLEFKNRAFGTLSGGQAQRALIARALVNDPELLLLDEPTASVDPEAQKEIHQLLSQFKGKMTILMVTHDLQPILNKAEKLFCVQGKVTTYLPQELCQHFALGLYHSPLPIVNL